MSKYHVLSLFCLILKPFSLTTCLFKERVIMLVYYKAVSLYTNPVCLCTPPGGDQSCSATAPRWTNPLFYPQYNNYKVRGLAVCHGGRPLCPCSCHIPSSLLLCRPAYWHEDAHCLLLSHVQKGRPKLSFHHVAKIMFCLYVCLLSFQNLMYLQKHTVCLAFCFF